RRQANVHLPWSNGQVYWDCGNDGTGYDRINLPANANDFKDRWTHWAFTKNAATGEMRIWLDGQLFHSGTGLTRQIDMQNFRIGRSITGGSVYNGFVDEFRVWSSELDSATIRDWMFRDVDNSHPDYASLVSYWKLNEGTGSNVADASATGASATIRGAPVWRSHRGATLHRNFSVLQNRPNTTFVSGVYTTNTINTTIRDSVLNPQNQVIEYTVNGTDLLVVDTNYYYQAGYQYVYDENGTLVDSVMANVDSTINISTLTYYTKGPMHIELMSFVTPYGNGLDLGPDGVMWEFDMTDYAPILKGRKHMYLHRGGQNQEEMDIRFIFIEGTPPRDVHSLQNIWPLTGFLGQPGNSYSNIANDVIFEPRSFALDPNSDFYKIRSSITGHGQNGEFIRRWHYVDLDGGQPEWRWQVWTECSAIPVYPQGGTWLFDRAGWCPGDPTDLEEYPLDDYVSPGDTTLIDYGIDPVADMSASNYLVAQQMVSYGPRNFGLDACIPMVTRPSDRTAYSRWNPACNEPIIILRNEGDSTLTSVDITYNVRGGATRTYNWTGTLEFLEEEEVALPVDNASFWMNATDDVFEVALSNPNGGIDENTDNDVYASRFESWDVYTGNTVDFFWRTNNRQNENSWFLYDENGTVLAQNSPFLAANTVYTEVFNLPAGC
ncbi:MAG: LamG-like jellyroll fold domain-containing protein, partial [Bacteroidota bacterium]